MKQRVVSSVKNEKQKSKRNILRVWLCLYCRCHCRRQLGPLRTVGIILNPTGHNRWDVAGLSFLACHFCAGTISNSAGHHRWDVDGLSFLACHFCERPSSILELGMPASVLLWGEPPGADGKRTWVGRCWRVYQSCPSPCAWETFGRFSTKVGLKVTLSDMGILRCEHL